MIQVSITCAAYRIGGLTGKLQEMFDRESQSPARRTASVDKNESPRNRHFAFLENPEKAGFFWKSKKRYPAQLARYIGLITHPYSKSQEVK